MLDDVIPHNDLSSDPETKCMVLTVPVLNVIVLFSLLIFLLVSYLIMSITIINGMFMTMVIHFEPEILSEI